jgi:hypothetical protein
VYSRYEDLIITVLEGIVALAKTVKKLRSIKTKVK